MSAQNAMRLTKTVKKLEKPRPLKVAANQNRHSIVDSRLASVILSVEDVMSLVDAVSMHIINGNYDKVLQTNVITLGANLKIYGAQLEAIYKDQLDRAYVIFRNGCRDDRLDVTSRMQLLELIELRATNWSPCDNMNGYYKPKLSTIDTEMLPVPETPLPMGLAVPLLSPGSPPIQPPLLSPGEVIKTSGKFAKPTKIPGKNYCKDEVVIRNSDSGKVMGIKGRRVHLIEELSETIISFQRVSPGAKERLVQITGPAEEKINYAKQLMEETIRRNASPVRPEQPERSEKVGGSSSSLNSSASDDSSRLTQGMSHAKLLHSFSTNDASLGEYKYTVTVGNHSLKITGTNLDIVRSAKLVLDEYFSGDPEQYVHTSDFFSMYDDEPMVTATPTTPTTQTPSRVGSLDSAATSESDDTYKGSSTAATVVSGLAASSAAEVRGAASGDAGGAEANQLTVVRQPLFPAAPREAFAAAEATNGTAARAAVRAGDVSARNRRALFAITNTQQAPGDARRDVDHAAELTPLKMRYSREFLLQLALSAFSSEIPADWEQINADCPAIIKKVQLNDILYQSYNCDETSR